LIAFYKFLIKVTVFLFVGRLRESLNSELSIAEQMVSLATVHMCCLLCGAQSHVDKGSSTVEWSVSLTAVQL